MKKTVIILDHNGGRMGNQLWNYINILAYCFERGFNCKNPSFYDYNHLFIKAPLVNRFVDQIINTLPGRIKRKIHTIFVKRVKNDPTSHILHADRQQGDQAVRFYLPPSVGRSVDQETALKNAENSLLKNIFFVGWAFRNPEGLEKHREKILTRLVPRRTYTKNVEKKIADIRKTYSSVIGVHIRLGDYRDYAGGKFFFSASEVGRILFEYIKTTGQDPKQICFYICSDEAIDTQPFEGLNIVMGRLSPIEDIWALSKTDRIIASDSTFSGLAAWYGNIPIVLFSKSPIDWKIFSEKKTFNYNYGSYNLQP